MRLEGHVGSIAEGVGPLAHPSQRPQASAPFTRSLTRPLPRLLFPSHCCTRTYCYRLRCSLSSASCCSRHALVGFLPCQSPTFAGNNGPSPPHARPQPQQYHIRYIILSARAPDNPPGHAASHAALYRLLSKRCRPIAVLRRRQHRDRTSAAAADHDNDPQSARYTSNYHYEGLIVQGAV